jgi:fatty-acid desaturase
LSKQSTPEHWQQPWWHVADGQTPVFVHLVAIHTLAAVGIALHPIPGWPVLLVTLALVGLGGLGTTVCYHRALAHRSVRLNAVAEQMLIFAAVFNGSGSPRQWVANHRRHHATSDTPADISSPRQGGFWWAHIFWLYQIPDSDPARWNADMNKTRYNVWTPLQIPTIVLSICAGLLLGWAGFFWVGAIRLVYSLHLQCLVNSLTHLGEEGAHGDSSIGMGRELAPQPPLGPGIGALRTGVVADRHRLVCYPGAGAAWPRRRRFPPRRLRPSVTASSSPPSR